MASVGKGHIERLPSGSYRVRVYAGTDPLTGREIRLKADEARLSAFIRGHIGIDGHYAFHLPDLGGSHRPLRDPNSRDD